MANSRFRVDDFRSYQGSPDGKATSPLHRSKPTPISRYLTPTSITEPLPSFPLSPSSRSPHTRASTKQTSPTQTHPRALVHPLPARPPAEVCANTRSPRSPLSLPPGRHLGSRKEHLGQPADSSNVTASNPAPSTPALQEAQPQSSATSDRHDTDLSSSWPEAFDDIAINEITHHLETDYGLDSSPILYSTQPDAVIPIDPAILGDTASAQTHCWQEYGDNSDFRCFDEPLQEWGSIGDQLISISDSEPEGDPEHQATTLNAVPSYEPLDPRRHPSQGPDIETETAIVPDTFRATGNRRKGVNPHKKRHLPEHSSDQSYKRVRTGATPSEDTNLPLLPTLCSHFLETPLDGRLEFLSWLFEGALARCASELSAAPAPSSDRVRSKGPKRRQAQHPAPTTSEAGLPEPRRKTRWEPEEIELLVKLRKEENRWSDVVKRFTAQFPGRSAASIQMYWSSNLKDEQEKSRGNNNKKHKSVAVVIHSV